MNRSFAILVCLLPLAAAAGLYESRERRISVYGPMGQAKEWLEFVLRADKDVQSLLDLDEKQEPAHALRLRLETKAQASRPFQLAFTGKEYRTEILRRVYVALLQRAVTPANAAPVPLPSAEWLAASLTLRELSVDRNRLGRVPVDYEPVRVGFRHGVFPILERLLADPVPADKPMLYRFYATHCDIFVTAVKSETGLGANPFRQMLDLERHGRPTMVALEFVLRPCFKDGENPQTWYQRVAPLVSRKGRRRSRGDDVRERLEELTSVPALVMGGGADRIKRVPIEELPRRLEDYRLDAEAISRIYAQVFELYKDAPVLLQEPLAAHMTAFDSLRKGKIRRFRKELKRARKQFAEALEKQRAVEALLDSMEEDATAPDERFAPYLEVIDKNDADVRQLDPKLGELLDKTGRQ
jgi:hypothetical protein